MLKPLARLSRSITRAAAIIGTLAAIFAAPAEAGYKLKILHVFCEADSTCPDGTTPEFGPTLGPGGIVYGTTQTGGNGSGVVYALVPKDNRYAFKVVYSFSGADGRNPYGPLIVDVNGNVIGTTFGGGKSNQGTVFELVRSGRTWTYFDLYDFCAQSDCSDGGAPFGKLTWAGESTGQPYDGTSPLYGVTQPVSTSAPRGLVFRLNFVGGQTKRTEDVVYRFCQQANCPDGANPAGISADPSGNLFGVAAGGGAPGYCAGGSMGCGVVFEISGGVETVLYNFCRQPGCEDGYSSSVTTATAPVIDGNGDLVGTTYSGGGGNQGLVYRMTPNGINTQEVVLYNFGVCAKANCWDGSNPSAVAIGPSGTLFGSSARGASVYSSKCNSNGCGTIYRLNGSREKVLYSFCMEQTCDDGTFPAGPIAMDAAGNMFGVTTRFCCYSSPASKFGTVFELKFTP